MRKIVNSKGLIGVVLSSMMLFTLTTTTYAAVPETSNNATGAYIIINGTEKVYVGEDYENPETGEYIHWISTYGTVKSFTYKIRYSVASDYFVINSTSVNIDSTAYVTDSAGNIKSGYDGHKYSIRLEKLFFSKTLNFAVNGKESGTISGLTKGAKYMVVITNSDTLDSNRYLTGDGSISI